MPRYEFICDTCSNISDIIRPMSNVPQTMYCYKCHNLMRRNYQTNISAFKPYREEHAPGAPYFSTPKERDNFLEKNMLTYDSFEYTMPSKPADSVETLDVEKTKHEIETWVNLQKKNKKK